MIVKKHCDRMRKDGASEDEIAKYVAHHLANNGDLQNDKT